MKWLQWFSALQSSNVTSVWNRARKMRENLNLYSLDVSVTGKMTLTHFIAHKGNFDFYPSSHLKMNPGSIGLQKKDTEIQTQFILNRIWRNWILNEFVWHDAGRQLKLIRWWHTSNVHVWEDASGGHTEELTRKARSIESSSFHVCVYLCIYKCVCFYVCLCVCAHVCVHLCIHKCVFVCTGCFFTGLP